jgi:hypothetical protein
MVFLDLPQFSLSLPSMFCVYLAKKKNVLYFSGQNDKCTRRTKINKYNINKIRIAWMAKEKLFGGQTTDVVRDNRFQP